EDWVHVARELTEGRGLDVVCEMSGHPDAVRGGMQALRNAGRLSLLGLSSQDLTLNLSELVVFKGLTVQGIIGRRVDEPWHQMTALLRSGRLDIAQAITHVMPIASLPEAMETLARGQAGKIVLVPWGEKAPAPSGRTGEAHVRVPEPAATRA